MPELFAFLSATLSWALLFKPFFGGSMQQFSKSAKCAFTAGAYIFWAHHGEFDANLRYALKFDAWFLLGCLAGYLVKSLFNFF